MDSGFNRHVTSYLEDYVSYQRFVRPGSAEIANKEELPILGMGIVIIKHHHTDGKHTNIRLVNVLYLPKASGRFYSTGAATQKGCEARETWLTNKIYSSDGTLLIEGTRKQATGPCYFNAQILQGDYTNVPVKLSAINISQSNLWHQRLAHANYEIIRALPTETTSSPDQKIQLPLKVCDGCEKGKSKRLPFPPSMSRAKNVLDLVHSDLDKMSSASIDGYIYSATYLNDHSWYGMMFFLKNKSEQFRAFKAYKVWAERHTDRTPNVNARLPTTKWESRTVTANYTEQGGVNEPHGRTQFRFLELRRQDCDSCLQRDANSKRQVQNTKENVERIDTWHLTPPHLWMFCICHHQQKEKVKAQSKESRNDLYWLWTGIKGIPVLGQR